MIDASPSPPRKPWQFSLRSLLIAATVWAVAIAPGAYLGWEIATVSAVFAAFITFCVLTSRWPNLLELLSLIAIVGVIAALLIPPIDFGRRTPSSRSTCTYNLKQLAIAMQLYHQDHGHFPPAYVADANGTPLLSWRVLLLPYLEEKQKFAAIKLDEAWNSPNNAGLADCPSIFQCPADPQVKQNFQATSYVVVTGPGTAFPNDQSTRFDDFKYDGTSKTILIVEVANSGIHWMEPRDLNIQQMATTINSKSGQGISSNHASGAVVVFADGHTQFLPNSVTPEQLRAMLTVDGGAAESPVPEFD